MTALRFFRASSLQPSARCHRRSWPQDASPLDVVARDQDAWVLVRNQRSLYTFNRMSSRRLAGPGLGWMQDPRRLLASNDGRLLISDAGRNSVVAVDAGNGAFLGDLFQLGEYGYSAPDGLSQLADGTVLVAAADQDAVLAFAADTGAFLGERVPRRGRGPGRAARHDAGAGPAGPGR